MISIKTKLVISHTSAMLLVAVVTIGILASVQLGDLKNHLNERADSMALSFSEDYAELVSLNTNEKAVNFTSHLRGIPDLVYLFLYDLQGEQIFSYHSPREQNAVSRSEAQSIDAREYLKPVYFGDRQIGSIRIALSTQEIRQAQVSYLQVIAVLAAGILLLALLLPMWIQRLMSEPVVKLAALTRDIAQSGDYSQRVKVRSADEIGTLYHNFNMLLDATEKAEEELVKEKERVQTTLSSLAEGVITTDEMCMIQYMNPVAEATLGCIGENVVGQSIDSVLSIVPTGKPLKSINPIDQAIAQNQVIIEENNSHIHCHITGEEIEIDYSVSPIRNAKQDAEGAVFIFRDVGRARELARQLSDRAKLDTLTGFYNREYFETLVDQALGDAREAHDQHALFYIDLDQFKVINETHGFVAGDGLIRSIAEMLTNILPEQAQLARLGSDEFGVLIQDCNSAEAEEIGEKLVSYISNYPFIWDQKELSVKASVGCLYINKDSDSTLQLLANAGMACMAAKEMGGGRLHFYQPDDINMARRMNELRWVEKVKIALQEDQFELYYQPMIPLDCTREDRPLFEILLRYRSNAGDLVGPGRFLPAAEKHHLMPEIDRWVVSSLLNACQYDASNFGRVFNSNQDFIVSINLSGQSIGDSTFHEFIEEQFRKHDVDPSKFCFEITETAAISSLGQAHKFIQQMRSLGCKFALDDFGSGMSSFSYLKKLPVDYLKIDGSYVKDIAKIPADYELVKAVNQIGKVLNIHTVAEFVEDEETANLLAEMGVDYAQGYFYAIPNPLSVAPELYCATGAK
ncbi:MAG: EAL domain-containing protein [bacterium]